MDPSKNSLGLADDASVVQQHSCFQRFLSGIAPYTVPLVVLFMILVVLASILVSEIPGNSQMITGTSSVGLPVPDGSANDIVWFLHVSDIHLEDDKPERLAQFSKFCNESVAIVQPRLVLATGDLTDGPDFSGSGQVQAEWESYSKVLADYHLNNKSFWLDLRGNHDSYKVPTLNSTKNLYRKYGVQGSSRYYSTDVPTGYGTFRFVSMDISMNPGLSSPFVFFGAPQPDFEEVITLLEEPTWNGKTPNHTFIIGHYPMSTTSNRIPWNRLAPYMTAYFCGHLHLYGMYRRFNSGYLELEVEDMKNNQAYRLLAIDHDLVSFTDVHLDEWPLITVTNPKDAQFLSEKEPISLISRSTHIRVLVFSNTPIIAVTATIGETVYTLQPTDLNPNLYVSAWNPSDYALGLHSIVIVANDTNGSVRKAQTFSLDGSVEPIPVSGPTMINGFPSSIFVDVMLALTFAYILGLLVLIPRLIFWWTTFRASEKFANVWQLSPTPVLVNENDYGAFSAYPPEWYSSYKDLDNASPSGKFVTAWSSHMSTIASMPWSRGWGVILFFSLILLGGPILIVPRFDGVNWGIVFCFGAWTPAGFSVAVESEIFALVLLLFVFSPTLSLFVELQCASPETQPPIRAYTIIMFLLSFIMQLVITLQILVLLGVLAWLVSPYGLFFTLCFLIQTGVSLRAARQRMASTYTQIM